MGGLFHALLRGCPPDGRATVKGSGRRNDLTAISGNEEEKNGRPRFNGIPLFRFRT